MSESELERLIHHMRTIRGTATDAWAKGFAGSILRQSRKSTWRPSEKQITMMRRLVSQMFEPSDLVVIDE